jgi:hypothetical protein
MEQGEGGTDCVEVVQGFLENLQGRVPTRMEVLTIRASLEELYNRILRLRAMAPAFREIDLGEDVKALWKILRSRGGGLRSAASFL